MTREGGLEDAQDTGGEEDDDTQSPYACLREEIMKYSSLGDVYLVGDSTARTQSRQCDIYDFDDPKLLSIMEDTGAERSSANCTTPTPYGRHLLRLGSQHHLVIFYGMAQ